MGVGELKGDLIERVDTEARQREQTAIAGIAAVERLERLVDAGLTAMRRDWKLDLADVTAVVDDHEVRIDALESERARAHWLRELIQPWRALTWTTLGAFAAEGLHLLIT